MQHLSDYLHTYRAKAPPPNTLGCFFGVPDVGRDAPNGSKQVGWSILG
jgi:hypothetical protein